MLMLDPFAGMDPAVREIAQTRLFAERAMYLAQKMPSVMRWQVELLSLNATQTPAVQQVITNSTEITATLERVATVAEKLPDQLKAERVAIVESLQSQEKDISGLMAGATGMSDSLNTTLTTFEELMKLFGVGDTNSTPAPDTNSEPFRIQDYTASAAQLESTARQLTELITTLDQTLASTNLAALPEKIEPAVAKAEASGKAVVDYAFWRGLILVAFALLAAMLYRYVSVKLRASARN